MPDLPPAADATPVDTPDDQLEQRLDDALAESFPASDPVAVHRIETTWRE
ncbi:hypothetical protein [Brevundimonas sp. GCM10030266]